MDFHSKREDNAMTTELLRDHKGELHLYSDGRPVDGARVTGIGASNEGALQAIVVVPLAQAKVGEVRNVIPFVRAERADS
jgi:hypothetical protein